MLSLRTSLTVLGALAIAGSRLLNAQSAPSDSAVTARPPAAFSMVETKRFAVVAGLGGLAYLGDQGARDAVRGAGPQGNSVLGAMTDFGNVWGQPGVVGVGFALWGGGLVAKNATVAASGLRAIEAITVSGTVTSLLKMTFGRARPYLSPDAADDFRLFRGAQYRDGRYSAMPSGHATVAFAFASAVTGEVRLRAPQHARTVGVLTYGAAAVTAYARMHDDRHWLSDVMVGAGIGTVTGWAITRWHATRPENAIDRALLRPVIAPSPYGGVNIGLTLRTQ
jgi:membrane-associated phospholipid phosphatase